jgi:DNA-binding response OmpR family regulator
VTANHRILVIDDSPLIVEVVREGLEDDNVDVEGLVELPALDQWKELDRFDLIMIDVQMPAMLGDDVAMALRGHSVSSPIVLLSSLPEPELAARARDAGADGYISKRRGFDSLIAEVRMWLDGTKRRQREP